MTKVYKSPDYDSRTILKNPPDMWMREIRYVESALLEQAKGRDMIRVVEWGSGNSSIHFPLTLLSHGIKFHWICIENFVPWYEKVVQMIAANGLSKRVEIHLKDPTHETSKDKQEETPMTDFINFPTTFKEKFNVVIVDARKRDQCLLTAPKVTAPGGIVLLHDAERVRYHGGFEPYHDGGRFVTESVSPDVPGGVQKLWAGRPKAA